MFEKEAEEYNQKVPFKPLNVEKEICRVFQKGAEFGYNKAKKEMIQNGLALQSDMDKTIEQNIQLEAQIEKMKCYKNCQTWNEWQCPCARNELKDYVEPLNCPCVKWELRR